MNWVMLVVAGLLEVVWALGLKRTEGFTRLLPSVFTLGAMGASFYLLSVAVRTLPLGTAYAVWVGIGAVGTAVADVVVFGQPMGALKTLSLLFVIAGIVGLRISSAS